MSNSKSSGGMWDGRFTESTDAFVQQFTASVEFDQQLYPYDIQGSVAHARMLEKVGILTASEADIIIGGLQQILKDIQSGTFVWDVALEDVHMNIESRLTHLIGDVGKKLHTARSRNDQVATDIRLYLRSAVDEVQKELLRLAQGIVALAEQEAETLMPGFTHLQIAQPISFGHHLLAWYEMLKRDFDRLNDCRKRIVVLPLGAAAMAGTTFPIDREFTCRQLNFDHPANNSLDAVSDRDFAIEFTACASIMMMHLSRMAEEMVVWSSTAFDFIELPDRFCTGSSIMPQKKNPDVPELVRGKTGRVYGHLMALLTLMKSQPLAYNKDNQEDKEPLFDTVKTVLDCVRAFADMVPNIEAKRDSMLKAARTGYSTATDLADYLVRKGLPFRDAHEKVGQIVAHGIENQLMLDEIPLEALRSFSTLISADIFDCLTVQGSVGSRHHLGGTAIPQVKHQVEMAKAFLLVQLREVHGRS